MTEPKASLLGEKVDYGLCNISEKSFKNNAGEQKYLCLQRSHYPVRERQRKVSNFCNDSFSDFIKNLETIPLLYISTLLYRSIIYRVYVYRTSLHVYKRLNDTKRRDTQFGTMSKASKGIEMRRCTGQGHQRILLACDLITVGNCWGLKLAFGRKDAGPVPSRESVNFSVLQFPFP